MTATGLYPIVHLKGEDIEIAFTHTGQYGEEYYSFVNGQHTTTGKPNATATAPTSTPVKTGHAFKGWYTSASGGSLYNTVTITAAKTFYAQFTANSYTLTWDLGDGNTETTKQTYGEKLVLPAEPTRKGAEFLGWFTELDGDRKSVV